MWLKRGCGIGVPGFVSDPGLPFAKQITRLSIKTASLRIECDSLAGGEKAGSIIQIQIHYAGGPEPVADRTQFGVKLAQGRVDKVGGQRGKTKGGCGQPDRGHAAAQINTEPQFFVFLAVLTYQQPTC